MRFLLRESDEPGWLHQYGSCCGMWAGLQSGPVPAEICHKLFIIIIIIFIFSSSSFIVVAAPETSWISFLWVNLLLNSDWWINSVPSNLSLNQWDTFGGVGGTSTDFLSKTSSRFLYLCVWNVTTVVWTLVSWTIGLIRLFVAVELLNSLFVLLVPPSLRSPCWFVEHMYEHVCVHRPG